MPEEIVTALGGVPGVSTSTLGAVLAGGINMLMGIVIAAGTLGIIYSGIKFAMSSGDPRTVEQVKQQLMYSIIGLSLGILGVAVKNIVVDIIGGNAQLQETIPEELNQ